MEARTIPAWGFTYKTLLTWDKGRRALPVVVADVDVEAHFRASAAPADGAAEQEEHVPSRPASSWQQTPGGTVTQRSQTARVRATG
jgi:hypothetical protein